MIVIIQIAGCALLDLGGFVLGAVLVPGFVVLAPWGLVACGLLFAAVSAAARPLVPYVTCSIVLVTLVPALLLVNSGVVWGTVLVGRKLGLGVGISGPIPVLLVACVIGAVRLTAAAVSRSVSQRYEFYAARAQYVRIGRVQMRYKQELNNRGVLQRVSK